MLEFVPNCLVILVLVYSLDGCCLVVVYLSFFGVSVEFLVGWCVLVELVDMWVCWVVEWFVMLCEFFVGGV